MTGPYSPLTLFPPSLFLLSLFYFLSLSWSHKLKRLQLERIGVRYLRGLRE